MASEFNVRLFLDKFIPVFYTVSKEEGEKVIMREIKGDEESGLWIIPDSVN